MFKCMIAWWGGLPCRSMQQKSLSGMDSPQDRAESIQSKCGEQYSLLTNQQIKPKPQTLNTQLVRVQTFFLQANLNLNNIRYNPISFLYDAYFSTLLQKRTNHLC